MIDVAPVQIVTGESAMAGGPSLGAVLPWVMMGLGAALLLGVAVQSLWRWYARLDDAERAFLWMSLRLRLGRRERGAVRALARGIDAAPVALLVSESAFRRGVRAIKLNTRRPSPAGGGGGSGGWRSGSSAGSPRRGLIDKPSHAMPSSGMAIARERLSGRPFARRGIPRSGGA